jgi:outer membrane protein OmpA-like peptidoglycan-associated protein
MKKTPALSGLAPLLLLVSCGSPPKPPTVDESQRRPVNSALAVQLQVCKNDLQNMRISAAESERTAAAANVALQQLTARRQLIGSMQASTSAPSANSVFMVRFDFGSSRVAIPAELSAALLSEARSAPLVVLRARTDGDTDSATESRVARARATAVRDYLIGGGVNAARIRATYQPVGDPLTDNATPNGRAMNRRVEIELYREAPVVVGMAAPVPGAAKASPEH